MAFSVELYKEVEKLEPTLRSVMRGIISELERHREEQVAIAVADFKELRDIVKELAEAQKRTEERIGSLEQAVEALAVAQKRTEERVNELVSVQREFASTFDMKIGALGGRWGLSSEEAFRRGMDHILKEVGFKAERFIGYDKKGDVFGHPDQVEMDMIVRDSQIIAVEIKSSVDKNDVATFNRKVTFYEQETGQKVAEKIFISPFIDPRGTENLAQAFGITICTDPKRLKI